MKKDASLPKTCPRIFFQSWAIPLRAQGGAAAVRGWRFVIEYLGRARFDSNCASLCASRRRPEDRRRRSSWHSCQNRRPKTSADSDNRNCPSSPRVVGGSATSLDCPHIQGSAKHIGRRILEPRRHHNGTAFSAESANSISKRPYRTFDQPQVCSASHRPRARRRNDRCASSLGAALFSLAEIQPFLTLLD